MHGYDRWRLTNPTRLPIAVSSERYPTCYDGCDRPIRWATRFTYECGHRVAYTTLHGLDHVCMICELMQTARRREDIAARTVGTYQI